MMNSIQGLGNQMANALGSFMPAFGMPRAQEQKETLLGLNEDLDRQGTVLPGSVSTQGLTPGEQYQQALSGRLQGLAENDAANASGRAYAAAGRKAQIFGTNSEQPTGNLVEQDSASASDKNKSNQDASGTSKTTADLSDAERQQLQEMKARDQEVRRHEQAHMSAGGGIAVGGASYEQERGPDGRMYAVGGEVQIDTSKGDSPEETIAKARQVKAAAMAPAEPSGQDIRVAAKASQMEMDARKDLTAGGREDAKEASGAASSSEAEAPKGATERAASMLSSVSDVAEQSGTADFLGNASIASMAEENRSFEVQNAGSRAVEAGNESDKTNNPTRDRSATHAAYMYAQASGVNAPAMQGLVLSKAV